MSRRWYVKTERSVRGPLSFQDVAFLIKDKQVSPDGLVRREEDADWQVARSIVGLLRAARKHPGLEDQIKFDDQGEEESQDDVSDDFTQNADEGHSFRRFRDEESRRIIEGTYQSLSNPQQFKIRRGSFMQRIMVWGPLLLIAAAIAYGGYVSSTYDRYEHKNFEEG